MSDESNLVELVELLLSIEDTAENIEKNAYVIYDKDGNKILL